VVAQARLVKNVYGLEFGSSSWRVLNIVLGSARQEQNHVRAQARARLALGSPGLWRNISYGNKICKAKKLFLIAETEAQSSIAPYSLSSTIFSSFYPSNPSHKPIDLLSKWWRYLCPPSLILTSPPLTHMYFFKNESFANCKIRKMEDWEDKRLKKRKWELCEQGRIWKMELISQYKRPQFMDIWSNGRKQNLESKILKVASSAMCVVSWHTSSALLEVHQKWIARVTYITEMGKYAHQSKTVHHWSG